MSTKPSPPAVEPAERVQLRRRIAMLIWRALALLFAALAVVGAFLPVMPTVPFLIVSAWAASRGWPAFEQWLLRHPQFGPALQQWRQRRAVSRRAKWASSLMMGASAIGLQFVPGLPLWLRLAVPATMLAVAIWLWRRPDA